MSIKQAQGTGRESLGWIALSFALTLQLLRRCTANGEHLKWNCVMSGLTLV
jgi:hypothetical protein